MDEMGCQNVYPMVRILGSSELAKVFPEDLVMELRLLFSDRYGPRLRDRVCHGLAEGWEFYGTVMYYAWWLICRGCFFPALPRLVRAGGYPG